MSAVGIPRLQAGEDVKQRYAHLRDETLKRGANVMSRLVAAAEEKGAEKAE